MYTTVLPR
ncbi:unnamed protein product, partial [Didymodactylos carnosus]